MRLSLVLLAHLSTARRPVLPVDVALDPFARRDPYLGLSAHDLRTRWSQNVVPADEEDRLSVSGDEAGSAGGHTLSQRLEHMRTFQETTYVDVRLAGFDGSGEHEVQLSEDQLQQLLDVATSDEAQHVMDPRPGAEVHELRVRRRFLYRVGVATPMLATRVAQAVAAAASDEEPHRTGAVRVPLGVVDQLVREEYRRQRTSHITLYLLNPRAPRRAPSSTHAYVRGTDGTDQQANQTGANPTWWHKVRYSYVDDGGHGAGGINTSEPSRRARPCTFTRWVGHERYIWVDLSAAQIAYGGMAAGDDVVTEHALPSVISLARRFTDPTQLSGQLAVELAALATTTAKLVLAPPIAWLPDRYHTSLTVVILRISDRRESDSSMLYAADGASASSRSTNAATRAYLRQEELEGDREWETDLAALTSALESLAVGGQRVAVETADTSLEDCRLCAVALSSATLTDTMFMATSGQATMAHNASVPRRLWAIGLTPHGPYSLRAELSFALRDTASRVALHALADEVLAEVKAVCHHFSEFGKRVDEVLSSAEHLPFLRRLNLLSYKLQRARSYLSLHNFRHAQYYILSTRHDLRAMREILDAAGAALKAQVVCH